MDSIENRLIDKINKMIDLTKEISDIDRAIGDIFFMNILNSIDIINAEIKSEELDISDKLKTISKFLGVDLEKLISEIIEDKYTTLQDGTLKDSEEVNEEILDFIINNSKDIDNYEAFLKENSVKENLNYLKGEL